MFVLQIEKENMRVIYLMLAKDRRSNSIHYSSSTFFPGKFDWDLSTVFWCYGIFLLSET